MEIALIIAAVILLCACGVCAYLLSCAVKRERGVAEERQVEKQRTDNLTAALHTKDIELARSQAEIARLQEKAEQDKQELEKLQASFRLEFRNLAQEILEEKAKQFKVTNKESLDQLLNPFKDNLSEFKKRVEEIYSHENEQRGVLKSELKNLMDLNRQITQETNNLTSALRGNSKIQGDWGEMILDTILEGSNLKKGIHYTTQANLKDAEGNNLRPDVILSLPEGKQIVIDSKVSLTAFVNYTEAPDDAERKRCMGEHIRSVRAHVVELGRKSYQDLLDSPDFVIMFIPTEPAFLAAVQNDSSIWAEAYNKKVIISSPTNLFALLKIVDDLWKRNNQSKNALEIAEEGAKMYDKFVGLVETLNALGKNIGSAQANYDKAIKQVQDGAGSLTTRAEKMRKLGIKASKSLPANMEVHEEEEEAPDTDNEEQ